VHMRRSVLRSERKHALVLQDLRFSQRWYGALSSGTYTVYSVESQWKFRRNKSPPSSSEDTNLDAFCL
jgi:hypothetical protein